MQQERTSHKPACFVAQVDLLLAGKLRDDLQEQGFVLSQPPYTVFSAKKKGVSCTLYESGKLTVQGKEKEEFIEFYLEPQILHSFEYTYRQVDTTTRIGVDEAGKGDFFGPLCIAGVCAGGDVVEELAELGVADSKKLSDARVKILAKKIKDICSYHVVCLNPKKYNELYSNFRNLNSLLAWGHATVIEELVEETQCDNAIIDQFAAEHVVENSLARKNININLTQRTHGESDVVVAAASILAREKFVWRMEELSNEVGMVLPKGASRKVIDVGVKLMLSRGEGIFGDYSKLHFKTYEDILALRG